MLLPVLVDLIEDDILAERLANLAALAVVGLFEIHAHGHGLAAVGNRDGDVLIHAALLLVDGLDDGRKFLHQDVHTACVDLLHMLDEGVYQLIFLGVGVKLRVESGIYRQLGHERLLESVEVHSLALVYEQGCGVYHHVAEVDLHLLAADGVAPAGVDGLALVVHHVVVFEQALADAEVVLLDLFLRALDGGREHGALEGFVVLHA